MSNFENLPPVDVHGISVLVVPVDSTDYRAYIRHLAEARGTNRAWASADLVVDHHGRVLKAKAGAVSTLRG